MARLNVEIPEIYLDVLNVFKVTNKVDIEKKFEKTSQTTALQYILTDYMYLKNEISLLNMLKNNETIIRSD